MAGDTKKLQPIIVKRVKKGGHAAHGGAWKIAYADFVTAMMAFFLLMWLLSSTTDGDRKGIQDYFNNPMRVSLSGGSGAGDATSVIKGGGMDLSQSVGQIKRGETEARVRQLKAEQAKAEQQRLEALKEEVEKQLNSNPNLAGMQGQIKLEMTRDGLRIQIVDAGNRPMFDSGSSVVKPYMRDLLREIAATLKTVPNRLTLEGHTDAQPYAGGDKGYSNWELSADRANASRRELLSGGLAEDRVLRVQGVAASMPLDPTDPLAPLNRRISIIVMNREAEERLFRTAPESGAESGSAADTIKAVTGR